VKPISPSILRPGISPAENRPAPAVGPSDAGIKATTLFSRTGEQTTSKLDRAMQARDQALAHARSHLLASLPELFP
jgi:hypothetical protein